MMSVSTTYPTELPVALRDTALTATSLAGHATPPCFEVFRDLCRKQIQGLRRELMLAGHPDDVIDDAAYAQCALLDEIALSCLKEGARDAWEHEPLQVSEFQSHDAGRELIQRIERRLAQAQPDLLLLAIFQAVLNLGFQGRFALDGVDARAALMRAIDERLGQGIEPGDAVDTLVIKRRATHDYLGQLSIFGWWVTACATSGIVYVALSQWLSVSIARLAH